MKRFLETIMDKEYFSKATAAEFIHAIGEDAVSDAEIAAILSGIQFRGVSLEELDGFREALLERATKPEIDSENCIDVCGTGGDGKDTFNISTTSALVLAAMGYKVIKHGNYGVSSSCGSSNVLESLGFRFTTDNKEFEADLRQNNICFLHAPLFHPTLKKVAPVRKQLGVRTIFNSLGPLVNPVQPSFQLTGTYSLELAKMYQHVLRQNRKAFSVVYAMDGYDEITLTDATRLLANNNDSIVSAASFGKNTVNPDHLKSGGTIDKAAEILTAIANGNGTEAQTNVVAANVATAIQTIQSGTTLKDAFDEAQQFIRSGQTAKHFKI
ncbi:MAG: anthranilate phosphoribosyltransferase [Fluviicola sp. XM-24bin1]|nr:MAG: anthranilate phosphoribosyltransferase [Fluviicola sp. XM-24bin1]